MWQTPQTITDLLKRNAEDFGNREAFVSVSYQSGKWTRHTWNEMDLISDKVAAGLAKLGVTKGQKIACLLANNTESYYTYLAIHKLGAVFVPINIRLVPREVAYIVENADADYLISIADALPLVEPIKDRLSINTFVCLEREGIDRPDWAIAYNTLLAAGETPPAVDVRPEDDADIIYTSGTTGLPKGVVLTHANKVACGRLVGSSLGFSRVYYGVPVVQNVFPFFTSSGCSSVMMMWLYFGFKVVLEPLFDVVQTLQTMEREKTTVYGGAPPMFVFLLNHPKFKEFDTSSLKAAISGAAAMPEEVIRQVLNAWPNLKIYNTYLMTEGGTGGSVLNAADALTKLGSIGQPCPPDQEVRVVDTDGFDLPPGKVGEIIIRGPNVMKAYYKNPEATSKALRNDWLYSGDMGYYDEDGYLFFTDRAKDMIVRGGFNVYSVEVESVLYEHPAVKQCAVVAKPHRELGEDIVAFVVLKETGTVTAEELHTFTTDKLADYKRPRDIRFLDELPLNPTGKMDKRTIRAQHIEEAA